MQIPRMVQRSAAKRDMERGRGNGYGGRDEGPWDDTVCVACMRELIGWLSNSISAWTTEGQTERTHMGGGVWQLQKRKGEDKVHLTQVLSQGTGSVLSESFLKWRREEIDSLKSTKEAS